MAAMAPGGTLAWAWEESEVREGNTARRKRARVQENADGELRELGKDGGAEDGIQSASK